MSERCELCGETLGDGWWDCKKCAREASRSAALASKDAEIERLRAIVGYFDTFFPDAFPADEEMGFDVESVVRPPWAPNQAAGATPHPRSEVSGSETPGNRSGDPE